MDEEPTTVIIQRYLDAVPRDTAAEPNVRELLEHAVGRLRLLCATFLYKSYPRLTRPPVNLETDELLGGVVAGLLTALRTTRQVRGHGRGVGGRTRRRQAISRGLLIHGPPPHESSQNHLRGSPDPSGAVARPNRASTPATGHARR